MEEDLFSKYSSLFKPNNTLDLNNPLIRWIGLQREVYPNDDMLGTLEYLEDLLHNAVPLGKTRS